MSHTLEFKHVFHYRPFPQFGAEVRPVLPVTLIGPAGSDDTLAIVDSGADYCLFNGERTGELGIALLEGKEITLTGLSGRLEARLHDIDLEIEGDRFRCTVAFSLGRIARELLGRSSFFDQTKIGFQEQESLLYFDPSP